MAGPYLGMMEQLTHAIDCSRRKLLAYPFSILEHVGSCAGRLDKGVAKE